MLQVVVAVTTVTMETCNKMCVAHSVTSDGIGGGGFECRGCEMRITHFAKCNTLWYKFIVLKKIKISNIFKSICELVPFLIF